MEDIFNTYKRLTEHKKIALPPKTTSFKRWAELIAAYFGSSELAREKDYWLSLSQSEALGLPTDFADGKNVYSSISEANVSLSQSATQRLLRQMPGQRGVQIHEALISAVSIAISEMTQHRAVLLELEGHGREDLFENVDVSRTIGWFLASYPVVLTVPENVDAKQKAMNIARQLRAVPNNGIGFGILRYLSDDEHVKKQLDKIAFPDVTVNYQGQFDPLTSGTSLVGINTEIDIRKYAWDPEFERPRKLQIISSVMNDCLDITIEYSRNQYMQETIKKILQRITSILSRCVD